MSKQVESTNNPNYTNIGQSTQAFTEKNSLIRKPQAVKQDTLGQATQKTLYLSP